MTIEIRELVIEARIVDGPGGQNNAALPTDPLAQNKLIDMIVRRVVEQLREEQKETWE